MTIHIVEHEPSSIMNLLPNELMFYIFWMLPFACSNAGHQYE
jgi:hypothetical protein